MRLRTEYSPNKLSISFQVAILFIFFFYSIFWMPGMKQEWSAPRLQKLLQILKARDENEPVITIVN